MNNRLPFFISSEKNDMENITKGWSRPKMHFALIEMLPYLTDTDLTDYIKMCKKELERRENVRKTD